jgi:GGDEF domain-containing protein
MPIDTSLRTAAREVAETESAGLILMRDLEAIGIVTAFDLHRALSLDIDPTTCLPRSGALRDWLSDRLHEGLEVAVIFIDLDDFGGLNKELGHVAGDEQLASVAAALKGACQGSEFASRFGGDEFAIGTVRNRAGAEILADELKSALPVAATFGLSGGRRARAREGAHVTATVEELLRLASLDCTSKKRR